MTDDFTTAARAEAEEYARTPGMNVGTVRDRIAEAHADGWAAARDHLAAQEPTDAEVEAADRGRVEHNIRRKLTDAEWAATRSSIEHESMRAALTAAKEARA